jgi:hypothetical protein
MTEVCRRSNLETAACVAEVCVQNETLDKRDFLSMLKELDK